MSDCSIPGTPTASKTTGSWPVVPDMAAPMRSITVRATPKSAQRSCGEPAAGSITSSAPNASASRRRVGREVGRQHGTVAPALQCGDHGQPHRAAADRPCKAAAPSARPSPTACSPTASGSVSAAVPVGDRVGYRQRGEALAAPCARPARPGRRWSSRSAPVPTARRRSGPSSTRVPMGSVRPVSGPCSTTSAQNSWPNTQSAAGSSAGTPTEPMREVKCVKSPNAWRSEPQIPAANERTTT